MKTQNELKMICHLRKDSRISLTAMSKRTKIPISTLFEMLKRTDKIIRNTCLLDFSRLGHKIRANLVIKVDKQDRDDLKKALLNNPNLNSLYKINNGYDYLVELVYRELGHLEEFLENLDKFKIIEKQVYYIIEEIKREAFLQDVNLLELYDFT